MSGLELTPLKAGTIAEISVPGSKSYTNRALVLAAMTKSPVEINKPLISDDTEAMLSCLKELGLVIAESLSSVSVDGDIFSIKNKDYELNAELSGTTIRFLLALSTVIPGTQTLICDEGLKKRPIADLVDSLRALGAKIEYLDKEGFPPLRVTSTSLDSGKVEIAGETSSQYLSSLLMIAPIVGEIEINITGQLISKPYVDMTIDVMNDFGVEVVEKNNSYFVSSGQSYNLKHYTVEGDYSSAAYFFAIAALTKSKITVGNLNYKSRQADKDFLNILEKMGNIVTFKQDKITLKGRGVKPISVDMQNCPDQAQTLAVLAAFADGTTAISGIRSLRVKETERIQAIQNELLKMGIITTSTRGTLKIFGGKPKAAVIDTYGDHRMAMSFAVAGSYIPGLVIKNPRVVSKTYPDFWKRLSDIGVKTDIEKSNIVLIGMRGTGKTTIGRQLAKELHRAQIDVDEVITKTAKMTTSEIVKKYGWDHFRKLESTAVAKIAQKTNAVISTGGGVVVNQDNIKALKTNGRIIWLKANEKTLARRRANEESSRPALTSAPDLETEIATVLAERQKLYSKSADLIIQTDKLSAEQVTQQLALCFNLTNTTARNTFLIIGDPVEHSLSPVMHTAGYNALGISNEFSFQSLRVIPAQLETFIGAIRSLNIKGVSVTIPHKSTIMPLLDEIDEVAAKIGAVNTVVNKGDTLIGFNTDWIGILEPIEKITNLAGKKVAILGAGGGARAAAYAISSKGAEIQIYNRTISKAKDLCKQFGGTAHSLSDISLAHDTEIIINTTSIGLNDDKSPVPSDLIHSKQIIFDAVYGSKDTPLIKAAKLKGAKYIEGREMLLHQGFAQFKLYTGKGAPEKDMREALLREIGNRNGN